MLASKSASFPAVCARRGGLMTAIVAGVPEVVLWMQSNHAQAARPGLLARDIPEVPPLRL